MWSADVTRVVNSVKLWNKNGGRKFLSITMNYITIIRFKYMFYFIYIYNMIDECHSGNILTMTSCASTLVLVVTTT